MALSGLDRRGALATRRSQMTPTSRVLQHGLMSAVLLSAGLIAWLSGELIDEAARGELTTATCVYLVLAVVGFCLSCSMVVFSYAYRLMSRLIGPSYRLIDAMKRVRTGDIGFRVHLRRGDMLIDIANEFNRLLDWLNTNPPCDVTMGSDVVDVEVGEDDDIVGAHAGTSLFPESPESSS
jgi:sensor histidine kinase YesM